VHTTGSRREQLTCREAVELTSDYLEDALPAADRHRFETHLRWCRHCRTFLDQMEATIRAVARLRA
jgi:predicted anti-sigma-YlaC factor YlaD